jgi:thymidylate synthase (FAD)
VGGIAMSYIAVLDHGFVRLVDHLGSDLSIARAARVSYDSDWRAGDDEGSDARLIRYLWRNKHTSPFEHVVFTFEVKAPIFVFRQWHRHRTWSYSELSARYAEMKEDVYVPEIEQITTQATDNKQARTTAQNAHAEILQSEMRKQAESAFSAYQVMLLHGCPRELARAVLPVATYSRMFATVDLHNLFNFLRLRLHAHAQYEIRVYAEAIVQLLRPLVPVALAAFEE